MTTSTARRGGPFRAGKTGQCSVSSRDAVIDRLSGRPLPAGTCVELVGVVHSEMPLVPDPAFAMVAAHEEQIRRQREHLPSELEAGAQSIRQASPSANVTWKLLEGRPADVILDEARRWQATAIVVGETDRSALAERLLQSIAHTVAARAMVPVEIIAPFAEGGMCNAADAIGGRESG